MDRGLGSNNKPRYFFELIEILLIVFALSWLLRFYVLDTIIVPNNDMNPTLFYNDKVLVDKLLFPDKRRVQRGDIVVFFNNDQNINIKRVLGLEGDRIEIRNSLVYINGKPYYESYTKTPVTMEVSSFIVPSQHIFVLGDNRQGNFDSIGENIPKKDLIGRVLFTYWSDK